MFDNDHMDEFDLQMRSILENGREEVPAGLWEGIAADLDKAARGKVISLWLRRASLGIAAAAAVVAGFIFNNRTVETDLIPNSGDNLIAVVEDQGSQVEQSTLLAHSISTNPAPISTQAPVAGYTETNDAEPVESTPVAVSESTQTIESPKSEKAEKAENKQKVSEKKQEYSFSNESSWIEEKQPGKRNIKTSLVLSGLAGTNTPTATVPTNIFRSPALDRAPATTIVQQTGTDISYGIPLSFGIGAKINFTKRWALSAGVNYSLLTSRFKGKYIKVDKDVIVTEKSAKVKNLQHYVGIPINAYYNIITADYINFYAYAGGAVEKCVLNKYEVYTRPTIHHTQTVEGVQLSANAGVGVEFLLGKHVGIYIDPSLRYYFKGYQPKSIRTVQPLMLGFEAGVRFNL